MKNLMLKLTENCLLGLILIGSVFYVHASEKNISINNGYVRSTIPGTSVSSAYMEILNNTNKEIKLIGASGEISDRIEIHQHIMEHDMMKMRQRESLLIEANDKVVLQPSGYHLMIFNLKKPLKAKEEISLTLHFLNAEDIKISLPVQSIKREKQKEHTHEHHPHEHQH